LITLIFDDLVFAFVQNHFYLSIITFVKHFARENCFEGFKIAIFLERLKGKF